jgi:hypothetical protein
MGELGSALVWRAATCMLAAGWVLVACGGGGDDVARVDTHAVAVDTRPANVATLSTASAVTNEPCRPPSSPLTVRRDTASIEREFVDELRGKMAVGVSSGAGVVDLPDPFEGQ